MSALALKLIACLTMLLDHIGFYNPGLPVLRFVGRLAFPIYVFLMTEGFRHTSDRRKYALRLGLFAILAQIPFSLFTTASFFSPNGSVMVTLLLAYLSLWLLESQHTHKLRLLASLCLVLGLCLALDFNLISSDYGAKGILLALVFYYSAPLWRDRHRSPGKRAAGALLLLWMAFLAIFHWTLAKYGILLLQSLFGTPQEIPPVPGWTLAQLFSLLSICLILLYNGKLGHMPKDRLPRKAVQFAFYAFYPVHMLILYWVI